MYKPGDLFLTDSDRTQARVIKFMMWTPTVWHYLYRRIFDWENLKYEYPSFYHAGIIVNNYQIVEQQRRLEIDSIENTFKNKSYIVLRKRKISRQKRLNIAYYTRNLCQKEKGLSYDIPLCFGKLFTWLTGMPLFTRWIQAREKEICITRAGHIYKKCIGETFGVKTHHELTTKIVYDYCITHPDEWEVVEVGGIL